MAYPRKDLDMSMGTIPAGRGADAKGVNDMEVCTYDESHLVSGGRYFSHIEECRKAYLAKGGDPTKMMKCPYRSSHHVAASMMDKHIVLCEGYYEWQMLNQEDPPLMKVLDQVTGKDETASETEDYKTASEMETDSVAGGDETASETGTVNVPGDYETASEMGKDRITGDDDAQSYSSSFFTTEDDGTSTDAYASAQECLSD